MTARRWTPARRMSDALVLDGTHVECFGTFPARPDFVRDFLAVADSLVGGLDVRTVYENILAAVFGRDEAESLLRIEELYSTCGQDGVLRLARSRRSSRITPRVSV